jgi:hypothetical protein
VNLLECALIMQRQRLSLLYRMGEMSAIASTLPEEDEPALAVPLVAVIAFSISKR